jgi:hypothetical protein
MIDATEQVVVEAPMSEHERELSAAIERFIAAMVAEGCTKEEAAARGHELITDSMLRSRRSAAVQARRDGDGAPGDDD